MIRTELWTALDFVEHGRGEEDFPSPNMYRGFTVFYGLFKAPATGQYRFTMSCTDRCYFLINNNTVADPLDPTTASKLMEDATSGYRNKEVLVKTDDHADFGKKFSRWESFT